MGPVWQPFPKRIIGGKTVHVHKTHIDEICVCCGFIPWLCGLVKQAPMGKFGELFKFIFSLLSKTFKLCMTVPLNLFSLRGHLIIISCCAKTVE